MMTVMPFQSTRLMVMPMINMISTQDRILILTPSGAIRSVPLTERGLRIGCVSDNDLVLPYEQVSPYHAQIEFDGESYLVTDLSSVSGSFLGNQKLDAQSTTRWLADRVLRIGNSWLRLEKHQPLSRSSLFKVSQPQNDDSFNSETPITMYVEASQLVLSPGKPMSMWLIVANQGRQIEDVTLSVPGPLQDWVSIERPRISLNPGEEKEVQLSIKPPQLPTTQAGRYHLSIVGESMNQPDHPVRVDRKLHVTAYHAFRSSLQEHVVKTRQTAHVIVENQGNRPETFTLSWQSAIDELDFIPGQTEIQVPAGEIGVVEYVSHLKKTRWFGSPKAFPFSVTITAENKESYTHYGEAIDTGLIPFGR